MKLLPPAALVAPSIEMAWPAAMSFAVVGAAVFAKPEGEGRQPVDYGYGMRAGTWYGRKYVGHEGLITGFNSALYSFPEDDVTIVVLTNTGDGAPDIFWKVASAYFGRADPRK